MSEKNNKIDFDFNFLSGFWLLLMLTLFFSYTCNTGAVLKTNNETYWVGCDKRKVGE